MISLRPDGPRGPGGAYLDTDAVHGLFAWPRWTEQRRRRARARLIELSRSGVPVVASRALLDEVAAPAGIDRRLARSAMEHLFDVAGPHLMRSPAELMRREVRAGGPVAWDERFEPRETRRLLWDAALGRRHEEAAGAPRPAEFEAEERARRDRITTLLRMDAALERTGTAASGQGWKSAEGYIEGWVRDVLRRDSATLGLADESRWPDARSIPTAWNLTAFKTARIHLNVGAGRSVTAADQYDAEHYAAACYAKVLVTDDADLRATCALVATTPFRIVSLEEFARGTLGLPA